jgi:hypothetical protein
MWTFILAEATYIEHIGKRGDTFSAVPDLWTVLLALLALLALQASLWSVGMGGGAGRGVRVFHLQSPC